MTSNPPINGDLRYALDLLLYSGSLADSNGSESILPEHVRTVHGETTPILTTEDISNLPDNEKLVLLAVIRSLKTKRSSYTSLKEIRSATGLICEELKVKPIDDIDENLQDLSDRYIIDIKSLTKIGISGASLENLDTYLNTLLEKIRRELNEL